MVKGIGTAQPEAVDAVPAAAAWQGIATLSGLPQRLAEAAPEAILANRIVEAIIFGAFRPRERLVEEELVERHQAKRHVVRAALEIVVSIGIAEKVRNRGVQVKEFTLDELTGIYAMRRLLQKEAVSQMALPAEAALVAGLERLQAAHAAAVAGGHLHQAHHLNRSFHELLCSACGNAYLAATIAYFELLLAAARSFRMHLPAVMQNAPIEHAAMIEAIRNGDRERLINLLLNHLRPARETYALMKGVWSRTD